MQTADILIVVFPCLALILLSLSAAGFYYWWTSTGKDSDDKEPAEEGTLESVLGEMESASKADPPQPTVQAQQAPRTTTVPVQPAAMPVNAPIDDGNTVEVMRVLRDISDGSIVIEINGQRYYSLKDMTDPKVGRRFLGNAQAVAEFARLKQIGGGVSKSVLPKTVEAAPKPANTSVLPDPIARLDSLDPITTTDSKRGSTLRDSLLGTNAPATTPSAPTQPKLPAPTQSPPKVKAFEPPSRGRDAEAQEEDEEIQERSIAEEIEEILQRRLQEHPEYRFRVMHIRQAPDGGVRVEVDGQFFDGVGDVSDEGARSFIQSVIREWEARQ